MVAHLSDRHLIPRAYAAFALKPVAEEPAVRDALLPILAEPAYIEREWAARSLGSSATEPEVEAALLSLLSDPADSVRAAAAEALAPVAETLPCEKPCWTFALTHPAMCAPGLQKHSRL